MKKLEGIEVFVKLSRNIAINLYHLEFEQIPFPIEEKIQISWRSARKLCEVLSTKNHPKIADND